MCKPQTINYEVDTGTTTILSAAEVDPPIESDVTGSVYCESKNNMVESEDDVELEDDEPDTAIKTKRESSRKEENGGKKQKKGLIARDQINTVAGSDKHPNMEVVKCKATGARPEYDNFYI